MIAPILTFILIQILNESSDIWYYFTTSFPSEKIIGILDPQYACYISIVVSPTLILMYRYRHMCKKEAFGKYCDFYKKNITFNVLGPVGDVVEEWELKGAFIQSANFGDLAFDSSDPVEISLTLRYDYAILKF